jgi:hypothetical protein
MRRLRGPLGREQASRAPEDLSEPHEFRDASSGAPIEGLLRGSMAIAETLEGRAGLCVCGKGPDDPIHAPQDRVGT